MQLYFTGSDRQLKKLIVHVRKSQKKKNQQFCDKLGDRRKDSMISE